MTIYREHAPHPGLAPFVRCVWELRTPAATLGDAPIERVPPDGCCEWVFHLAAPFELVAEDGVRIRQEAALFVGATTRAVRLAPSRAADVLGVRFHPGGARAFQRVPAQRFTDRIAPLAELELAWNQELHERLFDAPRPTRVALLQRTLLQRLPHGAPECSPVRHAVAELLAGRASVAQVAAGCGVGARQLQRSFRARVGVGPKELARIGRFQRALERLADGRASLADVALASGYADQAHFGREFRALAGITPGAWRREAHVLSDAFVSGE